MGYHETDFWNSSLAIYDVYIKAAESRLDAKFKHDATIAYINATIPLQKKIPKLYDIIGKPKKKSRKVAEQNDLGLYAALLNFSDTLPKKQ